MQKPEEVKQVIYLASAMIIGFMPAFVVPLEIGAVMDGLNIAEDQAGLLGTLEIFSLALSAMILPKWLSGWSPRTVIKSAFVICASSQFLSALISHFEMMAVLRCFNGVGSALLLASANSIIATSSTPETLYGKVFSAMLIMDTPVLALLPLTLRFGEFQGLFIGLGTLVVLLIPFLLKLTESSFDRVQAIAPEPIPLLRVALLLFTITVLYLITGGTYSFVERIGVEIGVSRDTIGVMLGVSAFVGILGVSFASWLGLRLGRMVPVIGVFLGTGLNCSMLVLTTSPPLFIAGIAFYGFLYAFSLPYVLGIAAALDRTGRVATATLGYTMIPYSMGPVFFGYLGLEVVTEYGWSGAALCLVMAILICPLIRSLTRNSANSPQALPETN